MKDDILKVRESIETFNDSSVTKLKDIKEQYHEEEESFKQQLKQLAEKQQTDKDKKSIGEINKLTKNIIDLTDYVSRLKEELELLKKQKQTREGKGKEEETEGSDVKNLIEFNELKSQISELKNIVEDIEIPKPKDYSQEIKNIRDSLNENVGGMDKRFKELYKEIRTARREIPKEPRWLEEQKDYSRGINQLAREIGEIKGTIVNRKYLERETFKIDEKFSEKTKELEQKQTALERALENKAAQPLVISLKEEVRQQKHQIEEEKEKVEQVLSDIKKENSNLKKQIIEENLDLKQEVTNLKAKLTRLYSATREERKEIIEKERLSEETKEKAFKIAKIIAVIIPLLLVGYILYANFLASNDFNYFYDIGGEQDAKKSYLTPVSRISDAGEIDGISYRNLTGHLVYFDVPVLRGSSNVSVEFKFNNNFLDKTKMSIGAKAAQDGNYTYNPVFNTSSKEFNNKGEWITASTSFNLKDLYIKDGKLNMLLNVPHLSRNATQNYTIPVDWIKIIVHKDGIFNKRD